MNDLDTNPVSTPLPKSHTLKDALANARLSRSRETQGLHSPDLQQFSPLEAKLPP